MAEKKLVKGSPEWAMFQDYWRLCQKYWTVEDTDEYWDAAIGEMGKFSVRHNTDFARRLAWAFLDNKEWQLKQGGGEDEQQHSQD